MTSSLPNPPTLSPYATANLDSHRVFTHVEPAFAHLLGRGVEQLRQCSFDTLVCTKDRVRRATYLQTLAGLEVGGSAHIAVSLSLPEQSTMLAELRMYRLEQGWQMLVCPIDAHHMASALFFSDACWRASLGGAKEGIAILDQDGLLVEFNLPFLDLLSLRSEHDVLLSAEAARGMHLFSAADDALAPLQQALSHAKPRKRRFEGRMLYGKRMLQISATPLSLGRHASHSFVSIKDLTAEMEAQRLRVDLARTAGMAQVATGVLHNVGNGLTSVNISASCIRDRVERSKVQLVEKIASLLRANADNLERFLNEDPKGQRLVDAVESLSTTLSSERQEVLDEIGTLRAGVEHVNTIISAQQSFARGPSLTEAMCPTALLDDALSLHASALESHGIKVVRQYAPVPATRLDRHRVMQILVNVLENAHDALLSSANSDKVLTVTAHLDESDPSVVCLGMRDNGTGIDEANLANIFSYGFTTKDAGHGFGLHSCANAATEMGGSLEAHSDGPGHGAAFVLKLPVEGADAAV